MTLHLDPLPSVAIHHLGVDVTHERGFCIDRPHGSGDYLLILFLAPILLTDRDGTSMRKSGSFIIYPPGVRQWYRVTDLGFSHHWLHCDGTVVSEWINRYRLPTNRICQPHRPDELPDLLTKIRRETITRELFWERRTTLLCELLFAGLGRGLEPFSDHNRTTPAVHERVRTLRQELLAHLERPWTLANMCAHAKLSRARLSAIYQTLFGISPVEDLIRARIDKARWILDMGPRMVSEVATAVGFRDLAHFSRSFHARVGCAPRQYRERPKGTITSSINTKAAPRPKAPRR